MKTIYLKENDITGFIDEIYSEAEKGETVEISMYGYKALVYPHKPKDSIRSAILGKLKDIKMRETNLQALRDHTDLSEEEIRNIASTQSPEEIADTCFEYGLVSSLCKKTL